MVIGDLNMDKLRWDSPDTKHAIMVEDTKAAVKHENFEQIIEGPTRFWEGQTVSLLDQIWVNRPEKVTEWNNLNKSDGDHNLIQVKYRIKGTDGRNNEIMKRLRRKFDPTEYRRRVSMIDWDVMYNMTDIDVANSYFEDNILKILNEMAPITKFQPRIKVNNWLMKEAREKMRLRDLARETAAKHQQRDDWKLYRKLRNKCTRMIKNDRTSHFSKINILHIENRDSANLFKVAKNRMNITNCNKPTSFLKDGKLITAPKKLADLQVEFVDEKKKKKKKNLPDERTDPQKTLKDTIIRWGENANTRKKFSLCKIGDSETLNLLRRLGNSTSMGRDGLDVSALKMAAAILYKPLKF